MNGITNTLEWGRGGGITGFSTNFQLHFYRRKSRDRFVAEFLYRATGV